MLTKQSNVPIVLSGPPRSGTTLFSALLDGHSMINWLLDEAFFFEHLYVLGPANVERFVCAGGFGVDSLIEGLRDRSLMPPTHHPASDFPSLKYAWSEESFRRSLASRVPTDARDFWNLLRDAYLAGFGLSPRPYLSMKAADYGRSAFGALETLPEARGVIIVREPVDGLGSLKAYRRKRGQKLLTWPTLVEAVIAMNRLAETVDRYDPHRLTVVRYEDFADDASKTMHSLCEWLGIEFEPCLLTPSMLGQRWSNNSSFTTGESGVAPLPKQRPAMLTAAEIDYVNWATMPYRERFGYV